MKAHSKASLFLCILPMYARIGSARVMMNFTEQCNKFSLSTMTRSEVEELLPGAGALLDRK